MRIHNGLPSLETKSFIDEIQDVLRERTPKYQAAADDVIETDGRSVAQVADEILARLLVASIVSLNP